MSSRFEQIIEEIEDYIDGCVYLYSCISVYVKCFCVLFFPFIGFVFRFIPRLKTYLCNIEYVIEMQQRMRLFGYIRCVVIG